MEGELKKVFFFSMTSLGMGHATKTDDFSVNFQGGEVILNPKLYVADFGPLYVYRFAT